MIEVNGSMRRFIPFSVCGMAMYIDGLVWIDGCLHVNHGFVGVHV